MDVYEQMEREQRHRCAICRTHKSEFARKLAVDHCHDTKKVRGLLCSRCNVGIGQFKESEKLLLAAIEYLQTHKGRKENGSEE